MKVLFVRPKSNSFFSTINLINVEPLELEYLGAICKEENWDYKIYDGLVEGKKYEKVLREYGPDVVGITGYCNHVDIIKKYARITKGYNPEIKVIVGGAHAELNYEDFYEPNVDIIVHSGGTETFRTLLRNKVQVDLCKRIKGICIKDENSLWVYNEKGPFCPECQPLPDRSHFYQYQSKFIYLDYGPCAMVKTAYGCPYHCEFCYCKEMNGGTYIERDLNSVMEEIMGINCEYIWIIDDTFLISPKRIEQFARLIQERHIQKKFIIYSRADFIAEHEELLPLIKKIGIVDIIIGLEAIDNQVLENYQKQSSKDVNERCVRLLNQYGITCTGLFILPIDAKKEDFYRISTWIDRMEMTQCTLSVFTPLKGTKLYDKYKEKILIHKDAYYDLLHLVMKPTNMSRFQFYYQFYKLYVKIGWKNRYRWVSLLLDHGTGGGQK